MRLYDYLRPILIVSFPLLLSCGTLNPFKIPDSPKIPDIAIPGQPYTPAMMAKLDAAIATVDPKIDALAKSLDKPLSSPAAVEAILGSVPDFTIVNPGDTAGNAVFACIGINGPEYAVAWRAWGIASDTETSILDSIALVDTTHGLSKSAVNSIPTGPSVQLLAGLNGEGFPNWLPKAQQVLNKAYPKYTVKCDMATVDNLKGVTNTDVFVFYTHGIVSHTVANRYLMATSTPFDPALYPAERAAGELSSVNVKLATFGAWKRLMTKKSDSTGTLFAITDSFAKAYWSFNSNSMVFFNACWSGSAGASLFRTVVTGKGASTIVGWSGQGDPTKCEQSTLYLLDRMLGANCVKPMMTPWQRPFGRDELVPLLAKYGYDHWHDGEYGMTSQIEFFPPSASATECGILTPSIKRLVVDEQAKKLTIMGIFGEDKSKGKVTIDGKEALIGDWSDAEITCQLKDDDCGTVRVIYADHKSNPVVLTKWNLKFTFTVEGPQSCHQKLDIYCPWRADLHSFREKADEEVKRESFDILPTHGAHMEYEASGTATGSDGSTMTYAGGGTTPSPWDGGGMNKGDFWASFDADDTTKLKVYESVALYSGITATTKNKDGTYTTNMPIALWKDMFDPNDVFMDMTGAGANIVKLGAMRLKKDLELDEKFGIKAGQLGPFTLTSDAGPIVYLLKWEACPATPAPVPEWAH